MNCYCSGSGSPLCHLCSKNKASDLRYGPPEYLRHGPPEYEYEYRYGGALRRPSQEDIVKNLQREVDRLSFELAAVKQETQKNSSFLKRLMDLFLP